METTNYTLENFHPGHTEKHTGYHYFMRASLNHGWTWSDAKLNQLLQEASSALGTLNGYAHIVPDISRFIKMHVYKEAVVSSAIEGTQTSFEEAMLPEYYIVQERRSDWHEVQNYIAALNHCLERLPQFPLSSRLLREAHALLMQGVRGENKNPGEFRQSQNWIGGATLAQAVFVPPVHTAVHDLMSELENFLHNDQIIVPELIRIGIAHWYFETIHPFLDGNGRVGRLLITLYMVDKGITTQPLLYLSSYFEENRSEYYQYLSTARKPKGLMPWLYFFLTGVRDTSRKAAARLERIILLKNSLQEQIKTLGRTYKSAVTLLEHLFIEPFITVKEVCTVAQLSPKAAGDLIAQFEAFGILKQLDDRGRNRIFAFAQYVAIFEVD